MLTFNSWVDFHQALQAAIVELQDVIHITKIA